MDELHTLHRKLFLGLKKRALNFEEAPGKLLKRYRKDLAKAENRPFQTTDVAKLLLRAQESELVYIGDFHTFDQNSKNLERLLESFKNSKRPIALGLEAIAWEHQEHIEAYFDHYITENEFLELIDYQETWRFPWHHLRPFFEMAKEFGMPIIGLNTSGDLTQRDKAAAQRLSTFLESSPESLVIVLFGELHIASNKLPRYVDEALGRKSRKTIIHQNLDAVYWKLREQGERVTSSVVSFNDEEFSLQSSPPWIKYESMAYWYEGLIEQTDVLPHSFHLDTSPDTSIASSENFLFLSDQASKTLELDITIELLEDFNLIGQPSIPTLQKVAKREYRPRTKQLVIQKIMLNEVFRAPLTNLYYCPNYSFNRLAYLSGLHIFSVLYKQRTGSDGPWDKRSFMVEKIKYFLGQAFFGHLVGKVFNPSKKCDLYLDIVKQNQGLPGLNKTLDLLKGEIEIADWKNSSFIKLESYTTIAGHLLAELTYKNKSEGLNENVQDWLKLFTEKSSLQSFNQFLKIKCEKWDITHSKKRRF